VKPLRAEEKVIRDVCPICTREPQVILFSGSRIPTNSNKDVSSFNLVACPSCETVYVNPSPSPASLVSYYPAHYYDLSSRGIVNVFQRLNELKSVLRRLSRKCVNQGIDDQVHNRAVLDVGCANGDNSLIFISAGWHADGVEPNPRLAQVAVSRGVRVRAAFLDFKDGPGMKYDVILLNHVLEHEYDPRRYLRICASLLKRGGLLYVEVPLLGTLSYKVFGRFHGNLEFPIHLTMLSESSLRDLIRDTELEVESIYKVTLWGTPMRSFIHRFPKLAECGWGGRTLAFMLMGPCQVLFTIGNGLARRPDAIALVASRK
jgi:SAM-dependent methyltransferase